MITNSSLLRAKKLKPKDTVCLVAPSSKLSKEDLREVELAKLVIHELGLSVKYGDHITSSDRWGVSAGTAEERARDIMNCFIDPNISAIWCIQGGDSANQILDLLDYQIIRDNPKIFIGLSDITVLLNGIHSRTGLITFHGPEPKVQAINGYLASDHSVSEIIRTLFSDGIGEIPMTKQWRIIREGAAEGKLIGGNLECFLKLLGTNYLPNVNGSVLILEGYSMTTDQALTRITQLRHANVLSSISAMIVGDFYCFDHQNKQHTNDSNIRFEDIVLTETSDYKFPIIKAPEFGHCCPNTVLPIGSVCQLSTSYPSSDKADSNGAKIKIITKCLD